MNLTEHIEHIEEDYGTGTRFNDRKGHLTLVSAQKGVEVRMTETEGDTAAWIHKPMKPSDTDFTLFQTIAHSIAEREGVDVPFGTERADYLRFITGTGLNEKLGDVELRINTEHAPLRGYNKSMLERVLPWVSTAAAYTAMMSGLATFGNTKDELFFAASLILVSSADGYVGMMNALSAFQDDEGPAMISTLPSKLMMLPSGLPSKLITHPLRKSGLFAGKEQAEYHVGKLDRAYRVLDRIVREGSSAQQVAKQQNKVTKLAANVRELFENTQDAKGLCASFTADAEYKAHDYLNDVLAKPMKVKLSY